jgi:UDP-N-acetylmuramyl tripeptide synthase
MNNFLIILGKFIVFVSRALHIGNGSTWPGHLVLFLDKKFIEKNLEANKNLRTIFIAGTNGKTTTAKLLRTILEANQKRVFQNEGGANLLNGIASSIIQHANLFGRLNFDFAIFEVDENTLPLLLARFHPNYLVILNVFRDQLDRYGEVNMIAQKWNEAINKFSHRTKLILNADDPAVAFLGRARKDKAFYFGLSDNLKSKKPAFSPADSFFCPVCDNRLRYKNIYFSHLGHWRCINCGLKRVKPDTDRFSYYPLTGTYNKYNTHAAITVAKLENISVKKIISALRSFSPAFGRQETIYWKNRKIQIFLSKNPTSFNQSLETVFSQNPKNILFVLNDRIPDGRDISWIWDVDFERFINKKLHLTVSGDRCFDMALRLKYVFDNAEDYRLIKVCTDLSKAIRDAIENTENGETLFILPTYSAMLEVRQILLGRKIL